MRKLVIGINSVTAALAFAALTLGANPATVVAQSPPSCGFTDNPLVPQVTPIKAQHITELRTCVNNIRAWLSLGPSSWTDAITAEVTPITPAHMIDFVAPLNEAFAAAGLAQPQWGDAPTGGVTVITVSEINRIRDAISSLLLPSAAAPQFGPSAGIYDVGQQVTLTSSEQGSTIRYTLDGSTPTYNSSIYSTSVVLDAPTTLRARSYREGFLPSTVGTATYVTRVAAPTITPTSGLFTESPSVTITTTTLGSSIRYTFNDDLPTLESSEYAGPLTPPLDTTVIAKAFKTGWAESEEAIEVFAADVVEWNGDGTGDVYDASLELNTSTNAVTAVQPARAKLNSTVRYVVYLLDVNGNRIPNTRLRLNLLNDVSKGGHIHSTQLGSVNAVMGRFSPAACWTGPPPSADRCAITLTTNNIAGEIRVRATVLDGPSAGRIFDVPTPISVSADNGYDFEDMQLTGFWIPSWGVPVGQTRVHPDNHYGRFDFLVKLEALSAEYEERWPHPQYDLLCINDISLKKGGVFDIRENFTNPHLEHRLGTNADIRARPGTGTTGPYCDGMPREAAVRTWFVDALNEIFGHSDHALEDPNTTNEHYHVRLQCRPGHC